MYKIQETGYEFNGIKLGHIVSHFGQEFMVIGFDTEARGEEDVALKLTNSDYQLFEDDTVNVILKGEENSSYFWAFSVNLDKF